MRTMTVVVLIMMGALAGAAAQAAGLEAPVLPDAKLKVPDGNTLAFALDASGVQIYECTSTCTGTAWVLRAPEATLLEGRKEVGVHSAGPTWRAADGSSVTGVKMAAFEV